MALSLDGINSGLDTSALIGTLVAVASGPKVRLEADQDDAADTLEAVSEFKTKLSALQTSLDDLADTESFGEFELSQSDESAFTATVGNSATAGTYESQSFAEKSDTGVLSTGTLTVTVAGVATDLEFDAEVTLSSMAAALDEVDGISAFVLDTGDASTPYKLVVMGNDTGVDNAVSFDTSGMSGGTTPTFTEQVSAQNAEVTVNGIGISSADNTLEDIIPGVDLALTQTTTDAVTVTVNRDDTAIMDKIEGFVDAWNELRVFHGASSDYDPDTGSKGSLYGEGTTRGILDTLGLKIVTPAGESTSGNDLSFSLLGISTTQTGNLELDREALQEMLDSDYDYVSEVFGAEDGPGVTIGTLMDDTYLGTDGFLSNKEDSLEGTIEDLEDTIDSFETRLEAYEARLREKFTTMEVVLGQLQSTQSYLGALLGTSTT
jgi:flagellar hook-associated protein 2